VSAIDDEPRQAIRGIRAEPLSERGSATLTLVRRHRTELTRWFADELGYRLDATRPGVARLAKLPGAGHEPRGLSNRAGRPFDGGRYALTCLVLASAESAGERTTLAGAAGPPRLVNLRAPWGLSLLGVEF
jgi:hypothetical protein